jgi:hypothetical protein
MKQIFFTAALIALVQSINVKNKVQFPTENYQPMTWNKIGSGYSSCGVGISPLQVYAVNTAGTLMLYNPST